MTREEEDYIYNVLDSIQDNSKTICSLVNRWGSVSERLAYKRGVYAPAVSLQVILGTETLQRCRKETEIRRSKLKTDMENYKNST